MTEYKYAGFISYAHADEVMAARLHHALETFKIPRDLSLSIDKKLHPIFRDTTELTAHHSLSEKIRDAVNHSRFLIVLCSPAAKLSIWVNEEIRLFRKLHGENSILCALLEGVPETSFPPALLQGGREPLAANLSGGRAGFRLGATQLAASMLGVGLDALIQRETKRRRVRARLLTTGSMVFAALMGGMAWTAETARDAAEISRTEAEKMVEFMLTDLKQDLEPVGKLGILDDVGSRVTDYYDAIPLSDMGDDRLARQARARHLLGQVALDQGKMDKAKTEIEAAYKATKEVLDRNPIDTNAIFAHAQSAYWVGEMASFLQNYDAMLKFWQEYNDLVRQLYQRDSTNIDWMMEAAWGQNNLGKVMGLLENHSQSLLHFQSSISIFSKLIDMKPDDTFVLLEKANALAGQSQQLTLLGRNVEAVDSKAQELVIFKKLYEKDPNNYMLLEDMLMANLAYIKFSLDINNHCPVQSLNNTLHKYKNLINHDPSQRINVDTLISYLNEIAPKCQDDISDNYIKSMLNYLQNKNFDFDINSNEQFSHLKDFLEVD